MLSSYHVVAVRCNSALLLHSKSAVLYDLALFFMLSSKRLVALHCMLKGKAKLSLVPAPLQHLVQALLQRHSDT